MAGGLNRSAARRRAGGRRGSCSRRCGGCSRGRRTAARRRPTGPARRSEIAGRPRSAAARPCRAGLAALGDDDLAAVGRVCAAPDARRRRAPPSCRSAGSGRSETSPRPEPAGSPAGVAARHRSRPADGPGTRTRPAPSRAGGACVELGSRGSGRVPGGLGSPDAVGSSGAWLGTASEGAAAGWELSMPQPYPHQLRMFTARATTSPIVTSDTIACAPIRAFAFWVSGIVSVGLNAVALVSDTYR